MNVTRRDAVLAVVALTLGWRLVASLSGVACELSGRDSTGRTLGQRFAAIDEPLAARRHRSLGFGEKILDAVVANTPEQALLLIVCAPSSRNERFMMTGLDLLWPRRMLSPDDLARIEGTLTAGERGRLFALTIADAKLDDAERWERVAGDARYALWRAKEPAR